MIQHNSDNIPEGEGDEISDERSDEETPTDHLPRMDEGR